MPKRSSYAIAVGLYPRSDAAPKSSPEHSHRPSPRNAADAFYFQLESFLDCWRRDGVSEEVVRAALGRAQLTSVAMEDVGRRLKGQ